MNNSSKRTIPPKQWDTLECKKDTPQCIIHISSVPQYSAIVLKLKWRWIICFPSHFKSALTVPGNILPAIQNGYNLKVISWTWMNIILYLNLQIIKYIPCPEIIIFIIIDFCYIQVVPAFDWPFGIWQLFVSFHLAAAPLVHLRLSLQRSLFYVMSTEACHCLFRNLCPDGKTKDFLKMVTLFFFLMQCL